MLSRLFSSCSERELLFIAGHGHLILVASLLVELGSRYTGFSSCSMWALECWLNSCGAWALLLHAAWDLPESGIEPMSSALGGRLSTTLSHQGSSDIPF